MDITQFDLKLLLGSVLAVLMLSVVMTGAGIVGSTDNGDEVDVEIDEFPELDADEQTLDLVDGMPQRPDRPGEFTLRCTEDRCLSEDKRTALDVDTRDSESGAVVDGVRIEDINPYETNSDGRVEVNLVEYDDQTPEIIDGVELNEEGDREVVEGSGYRLIIEAEEFDRQVISEDDDGEPDEWTIERTISVETEAEPGLTGVISRIPAVGGLTVGVAETVGWGMNFIAYGTVFAVQFVANAVLVGFSVAEFLVGSVVWTGSTYTALVSAAPGPASVVVVLPGVIISFTLAKMVLVIVDKVWLG